MATCMRVLVFLLFLMGSAAFSSTPSQAGKLTDAVKARDISQVRSLLAAGENVQERVRGDYPLNVAALFGPAEMVAVLLEGGAQIEQPNRDGLRPLHNAVVSGHPEIVALLIARGAKINSTDNQGRTPLISFAAIAGSNMDIPKMLLAAGADPAAEESLDHLSALDFAAVSSETDLAELLLSAGIDVNRRDSGAWGGTAIMHAIYHNRLEFVRLLIARGADVNLSDMQGKSTLSFATGKPEMQKLLIEAGAK